MESSSKRLETSDFILWIFLAIPLFFLPSSRDVFNFPKAILLYALLAGALIHYFLSPKGEKVSSLVNRRLINIALFGVSLLISASALFTDTALMRALFGYPNRSNGLLTYLALILLIWVASRMLISRRFLEKLQRDLLILIILFVSYSFLQYLDLDPVSWNNSYNRIIGTMGNPNFSGAFLGIVGAVLIFYFFSTSKPIRFFYLALSICSVFLGWATESFQAVLIFAIGILILVLAYLKSRFSFKTVISSVTASVFIGIILIWSFFGQGPLGERLYQPTLVLRLEYWTVGIKTALAYPFLGIGPDSYTEGWRLFRTPEFVKTYSEAVSVDSAHNTLINFMANFGIPAFVFLLIIYLLIGFNAFKLLFGRDQNTLIVKAIALTWLLLVIQSLFSLEQIGLHVFQWVAGSLLLNQGFIANSQYLSSRETKKETRSQERGGFSARGEVAIMTIVVTFIAFLPLLNQEIRLNKLGATPVDKNATQQFIDEALDGFGDYSIKDMNRVIVISDFLLRAERYSDAQSLIEEIVKDEPRSYEGFEQLARLAGFRGEYSVEIEYRRNIESFDPQNYKNLISLAEAYRLSGGLTQAKAYAEKVLLISSDLEVNKLARSIIDGVNS
jgi:O-antigen ligase